MLAIRSVECKVIVAYYDENVIHNTAGGVNPERIKIQMIEKAFEYFKINCNAIFDCMHCIMCLVYPYYIVNNQKNVCANVYYLRFQQQI